MKVSIITRNHERSPKVLALSLQAQLRDLGFEANIFYGTDMLERMRPLKPLLAKINLLRLYQRLAFWRQDRKMLKQLKASDVVVVSECIPNAFFQTTFDIKRFRQKLKRPVCLYEVYYLKNAPTQVELLKNKNENPEERFDWHLSVSEITEVRTNEEGPWSCIGLQLAHAGLKPTAKKDFVALVDFSQQGFEEYRAIQLRVLEEEGIKTIKLDGSYTIEEIRTLYNEASVYFMQSMEAFGLPLAECLACGAAVFTPDSAWPMSWRLDSSPGIHQKGQLPETIFHVYEGEADLRQKIRTIKENFKAGHTPFEVFEQFVTHYPHYYYGRPEVLKETIAAVAGRLQ